MNDQYKSKLYGAIASVVSMLCLFLFLWLVYIDQPYQEEDEGIMVSFGDNLQGGGSNDLPSQQASQSAAPQPSQPNKQELLTQDDESLALERQKKEEEKKRKEEQERIEAEKRAEEKRLAEEKAKQQQAIDKANQLGSLFGQSSGTEGSNGTENSNSTKGNPIGQGSSGGNSWSLNGRNLNGKLATPTYNGQQEGVVVVNIRVNPQGKVINATVGAGTTISDKETQQAAIKAAQQATFTTGSSDVIGNITYVFKLR